MRLSVLFEEFFVEVSHEIDRQKMLIPPFEIEFVFVYVLDYWKEIGVQENQK